MTGRNLNLIFLGPPGAGKGTQAKRIIKKYGIPQLSTGDLMRSAISSGSDIGEKVNFYISKGELVPDALVVDILLDRLKQEDCEHGFILDGFPRTVGQAEALEKALEKKNNPIKGVVAIIVPDEFLVERLKVRRTCRSCGEIYHPEFIKPKKEGVCDKCSGELYQRKDDTEEVIKHRLEIYHNQTSPLIDFYKKRNLLYTVDGNEKIMMIFQQICDIIDNLNSP
jgi:adenylate kinase